jgi:hypothetical protein
MAWVRSPLLELVRTSAEAKGFATAALFNVSKLPSVRLAITQANHGVASLAALADGSAGGWIQKQAAGILQALEGGGEVPRMRRKPQAAAANAHTIKAKQLVQPSPQQLALMHAQTVAAPRTPTPPKLALAQAQAGAPSRTPPQPQSAQQRVLRRSPSGAIAGTTTVPGSTSAPRAIRTGDKAPAVGKEHGARDTKRPPQGSARGSMSNREHSPATKRGGDLTSVKGSLRRPPESHRQTTKEEAPKAVLALPSRVGLSVESHALRR